MWELVSMHKCRTFFKHKRGILRKFLFIKLEIQQKQSLVYELPAK